MESTKLWNEEIPGYIEGASIPTIHYYPAKNKKGDGCVVIFAGGGYRGRAAHEGEGYAHFFEERGIDSFVVDYRFKPSYFPLPLLDARRGVRYVRANAENTELILIKLPLWAPLQAVTLLRSYLLTKAKLRARVLIA